MIKLAFRTNNGETEVEFANPKEAFLYLKTEYKKKDLFHGKKLSGELQRIWSDDPKDAREIAFFINEISKKEREKKSKVTDKEMDKLPNKPAWV